MTSKYAKGLSRHTVVIIVRKRERVIPLQMMLEKQGFRVLLALSIYDGLNYIAQEMPHLVITESTLSDGNASSLFDRVNNHQILKKTPIIVSLQSKTKEELVAAGQKKYAGVVLAKSEPKAILAKILQVISGRSIISPYFIPAEQLDITPKVSLLAEAKICGMSGEHFVTRSQIELDNSSKVLCVPFRKELGPVMVCLPTNIKSDQGIFNLFPIERTVGSGRKWIRQLEKLQHLDEQKDGKKRTVLLYEPRIETFMQFRDILLGYDIDAVHANDLKKLSTLMHTALEDFGCIYLTELVNDASSIELMKYYSQLPEEKKPPMIIGTTAAQTRSSDHNRFIRKPFGMGVFLDMLESALAHRNHKKVVVVDNDDPAKKIFYQAPAKLLGLDESGGVLEIAFPIGAGSRLRIENDFLNKVWDENAIIRVVHSQPSPQSNNKFQVCFEAVGVGMSKSKYYANLINKINTVRKVEAAS